jgi:large subunit ribosomal protein L4
MSLPASSANRTVDVVNASGAKAGTAELPAELFDVTANIPLIHQVVVAQLAAARQGTHSTKGRGEVRGGGKKPYRQKGTGRARQGSIRAPQYVGGGIVHGPQPHGYAQRTPKKMIAAALRGALSDRARDGRVHVISDLVSGDVPSTKSAVAALRGITASEKVLVVIHRDEDLAWLSLRNVITVHTIAVDQLNAYDVLVNDEVIFTSSALEAFVAGAIAGRSGKAIARESEAVLVSSEASDAPAVPVTASEQDEEPEYIEPDELSAPADTSAESVETTSDTGAIGGQAPPSPVSSGPAAATSEPGAIEEEDDK